MVFIVFISSRQDERGTTQLVSSCNASNRRPMKALLRNLHPEFPGHPNFNARDRAKVILVNLGTRLVPACAREPLTPVPGAFLGPCCEFLLRHLAAPPNNIVVVLAIRAEPLIIVTKPRQPGHRLPNALHVEGARALVAHNLAVGLLLATTYPAATLLAFFLQVHRFVL